ncbi:MAG TPA: transcription antitermination factor NusB, partial [Fibrobacteria bacterium]|nr:transcription antitermination factor NusB [Fibrobacteria bacterium]
AVAETLSRHGRMDPRDHGLALEIATTTIRNLSLLDHFLEPFLRGPTSNDLLWVLRLTLAQIHLLSRIPVHAAVDLGVELAREAGGQGASRFANAVLRRAAYRAPDPPQGDDAKSLSIRYSHPTWLVERWLQRHGGESTRAMLQAGSEEPVLWVRVRPGTTDLPWRAEEVLDTAHDGLFVRPALSREAVLSHPSFPSGRIALQDPSSGAVALALSGHLPVGGTLADLCAAPGGKLACLHDLGLLEGRVAVALDSSHQRQRRTLDGFRQRGIAGLVAASDGRFPPLREGSLDAVLLDAPCSNLGVLGRRPEARWRATPGSARHQGKLQSELLSAGVSLLKPGGVAVYSVCSTEEEECDAVVETVSDRVEILERDLHLPGARGWDGFFRATLRRR